MFPRSPVTRSRRPARTLLAAATAAVVAIALAAGSADAKVKKPASTATTTTTSAYANHKTESFSSTRWWSTWGLARAPWHTTMVTEAGNQFLRVGFPAGSHNGTSFDWPTGTADSAHIRYRIRLSSNWQSDGAKLAGFGNPTYNPDGSCSGGCGLAPADGITSWSARGHLNALDVPGSYLYTPDQTEWAFQWNAPAFVPGRWYTIDYWVTMNTPGQSNGVIQAAIDGTQVLNWTTMNFRLVDTLHVGKSWFGFYYGGTSVPSQNMWIDIDDVAIDY